MGTHNNELEAFRGELKAMAKAAGEGAKRCEAVCQRADRVLDNLAKLRERIRQLKRERGENWFKELFGGKGAT